MNASAAEQLPVVVIGAGPIGLAAAAHLAGRGIEPLVLEAGPSAGTAVRAWSHVRLFSPWAEVVDPAAEKLLAPTGWIRPDGAAYPSGGDWVQRYLQPRGGRGGGGGGGDPPRGARGPGGGGGAHRRLPKEPH
ncbi:FAD-dependent oxidoreductase, partial [Kitasatospora purpeofusca]|uniref:FAD-dependent oxidoreductase n=1 Tax=Kitasatospora purpeofusca TaxID=67352 RepID=UPI00367CC0C9